MSKWNAKDSLRQQGIATASAKNTVTHANFGSSAREIPKAKQMANDPIIPLIAQHEAELAAIGPPEGEEIDDDEMSSRLDQADETLYRLLMTTPTSTLGLGLLLQHLNSGEGDDPKNDSILDGAKFAGDQSLSEAAHTFLERLGTALVSSQTGRP